MTEENSVRETECPRTRSAGRRILAEDQGAVTELPFKIIIIAAVLAVTVPLIIAGLDKYGEAQEHNQVEREITRLENAAVQVYSQGENASVVIEVEFPDSVEYVSLGDRLVQGGVVHWRSRAIYYKLRDRDEVRVPVESSLRSVPITNETKEGPLEFGAGLSKIMLTKTYDDGLGLFHITAEYREV